mgnify:CR=1 FL=1
MFNTNNASSVALSRTSVKSKWFDTNLCCFLKLYLNSHHDLIDLVIDCSGNCHAWLASRRVRFNFYWEHSLALPSVSIVIRSPFFGSFQAALYVVFLTALSYALIFGSIQEDPKQYSGISNSLRMICEILSIGFLIIYLIKEIDQAERWVHFFARSRLSKMSHLVVHPVTWTSLPSVILWT